LVLKKRIDAGLKRKKKKKKERKKERRKQKMAYAGQPHSRSHEIYFDEGKK
jgi:hypothetical protein